MKNFRLVFISILLTSFFISGCKKDSKEVDPIDQAEGGHLFKSPSGSFYIVQLNGTFKEMGRQYGLLLKTDLAEYYKEAIVDYMIGEKGMKYEDLVTYGNNYYRQLPQIFKDYFTGMSETSGLSKDQCYILASSFIGLYETGCSSLSAWGDYTPDHQAVTGRNLDLFTTSIKRFSKYFQIVVWNPTGYPASVANIDYMGSVFYQTSINSKGIFLELQNGQNADTSSCYERGFTNHILLESLFSNTCYTEENEWFQRTSPECGLIMNSTYPDHADIYEWATFRVVKREGNGLIAASNDFIDPSWINYPIIPWDSTNEGIGKTWTRRTNLMNLGEINKGSISPEKMMEIFDMTIPEGGATFPEDPNLNTIYSVVAQPSQMKIWLKVRSVSGWEEIDLKKYFK